MTCNGCGVPISANKRYCATCNSTIVVRHFGTIVHNGHIISTLGNGQISDHGRHSSISTEQMRIRMDSNVGRSFRKLPVDQRPSDNSIVAEVDGWQVPASTLEMVWNDWELINLLHEDGVYENVVAGEIEEKILGIALERLGRDRATF